MGAAPGWGPEKRRTVILRRMTLQLATGLVRKGKEHRQECLCYLETKAPAGCPCGVNRRYNMGPKKKRLAGGEAQY